MRQKIPLHPASPREVYCHQLGTYRLNTCIAQRRGLQRVRAMQAPGAEEAASSSAAWLSVTDTLRAPRDEE